MWQHAPTFLWRISMGNGQPPHWPNRWNSLCEDQERNLIRFAICVPLGKTVQ